MEIKKKKNNHLLSFLFFIFGIILFYWVFKGQDFGMIKDQLLQANPLYVGLGMCFALLSNYIRALRWKSLFQPLGYRPSIWSTFLAVMITFFVNLGIPRFGELVRCWSMKKTEGIPIDKSLGTVLMERMVDLLSLLAVIILSFFINFNLIYGFFYENVYFPMAQKININVLLVAIVITFLLVILLISTYAFFIKNNDKFNFIKQKSNKLKGLTDGLLSIGEMQNKSAFLSYTIVMWLCYYLSFWSYSQALVESSQLSILSLFFVFSISGLGMAAPVQGGIGAFHWIVSKGFIAVGLTASSALVTATLVHASAMVIFIITGLIALVYVAVANPKTS